jgi:hypothetical protein
MDDVVFVALRFIKSAKLSNSTKALSIFIAYGIIFLDELQCTVAGNSRAIHIKSPVVLALW